MTLPNDLDILRPWASRTMECRYTCLKGTLPAAPDLLSMHFVLASLIVSTQFVSANFAVSTQFVSASLVVPTKIMSSSLGGRVHSCAHVKWPWLRDQRTVLHACLIEV